MENFYVTVTDESGAEHKRLGPFSDRRASKVEDGLNINLDHWNYQTNIEQVWD